MSQLNLLPFELNENDRILALNSGQSLVEDDYTCANSPNLKNSNAFEVIFWKARMRGKQLCFYSIFSINRAVWLRSSHS